MTATAPYRHRPLWKERAGQLALALGVLALAVGPLAALWFTNELDSEVAGESADAIAELDRTGTSAALDRIEELDAELDRVEALLSSTIAALDAERAAREHEHTELLDRLNTVRARSASAPVAATAAATTGGSFDALAACESTGDVDGRPPHRINPAAVSGTGKYRGAFQWSLSTWAAAGGSGDPIHAPYAEELARARAWAARADVNARGQWPTCWPLVMGNTPT